MNVIKLMWNESQDKIGRSYFITVVFTITAMMAGCGGDGSGQDLLLGINQAALSEPEPCEESMLTWPTSISSLEKKCSGAWRYELYPECEVHQPSNCGEKYCAKYEICYPESTSKENQTSNHTLYIAALS